MLMQWPDLGRECATQVFGEHLATLHGLLGTDSSASAFREAVWVMWQDRTPDDFAEAILDRFFVPDVSPHPYRQDMRSGVSR
jgi:hypothetical protein